MIRKLTPDRVDELRREIDRLRDGEGSDMPLSAHVDRMLDAMSQDDLALLAYRVPQRLTPADYARSFRHDDLAIRAFIDAGRIAGRP